MAPHLDTANLITLLEVSLEGFRSLWYAGRLASHDAEILARANLAAAERLGEEHPDALAARHNLGIQLGATGAPREAEEIFRAVLAGRRRALGDDHVDTLLTRDQLIGAIMEQGRLAETEPLYRELIADMTRVLGADHRETLTTSVDLAWSIGMQGRPAEAADICRRALERDRRTVGDEDPRTLDAWDDLSRWTNEQGDHAAAEQMCRELLDIERRVMGAEHQLTLTTRMNLARAIAHQGRLDEAEPCCARHSRTWSGFSAKPTTDQSPLDATSPTQWPLVGVQERRCKSIGTYWTFSSVGWATITRKRSRHSNWWQRQQACDCRSVLRPASI